MAALHSPRRFEAFAKPRGDHPDGHSVVLVETCGRSRRERVFTRAEAEQVRAELDAALRAFFAAESFFSPATTVDQVARAFGIERAALTGTSRAGHLVRARNAACWMLRTKHHLSLCEIGKLLGGRDHSTVAHALGSAEAEIEQSPDFRALIEALGEPLRGATAPFPFTGHKTLAEVEA